MVVITDMGNMHIETSKFKSVRFNTSAWIYLVISNGFIFFSPHAYAIDWSVMPTLRMQEIFSDNIKLSSKDQQSAFVTSVSPGVSIIGSSAKNMLNLNYNMQNLYNANGNNGLDIYNQLQFSSQHTFVPNRLFLQTSSSISQQNISNTLISSDNISGNNSNRTTVSTVSVSPYWTPHFSTFADGLFRLNLNTVTSGNNSSSALNNNVFSDSLSAGEIAQLTSGTDFKRVVWNAYFQNTKTYRSGGQDVAFQNSSGTVRTYIDKNFNVFATAGHSNNSFNTVSTNNNNGVFYTFGGQWKPSEHYSIEAGGGNNSYVTVYISPIQRLNWTTTYRHNSIGLNSGSTWNTNLRYQARNSTWTLTHTNDTTTTQALLLNPQYQTSNVSIGTNGQSSLYLPNLTDDVYVRKIWNFGVSYNTGKSTIGGNAFDEKRTSQNLGTTEGVRGVSASWNWQFAPKTSAYLYPMWQEVDRSSLSGSKDHRYDVTVGMSRLITQSLTGSLEFRHLNQSSELDTNNYQENRATASLYMRF